LFQFGKRRNCTIFTKIGTKLRQKLEYRDQIEIEEMTLGIILTLVIVTAMWHNDSLTRGKFFNFFKKLKKINENSKKIQKKNKRNSKN